MKPISETFRYGGFQFRLLKREGRVALFAKRKPKSTRDYYEVVVLRHAKAHTWPNGITTPDKESMPGDELWGACAWTPYDLPAAEAMFARLTR